MEETNKVKIEIVDVLKKIESDKKVIASKFLRITDKNTTISIPVKKNVSAEELLGHIIGLLDLEKIEISTIQVPSYEFKRQVPDWISNPVVKYSNGTTVLCDYPPVVSDYVVGTSDERITGVKCKKGE